MVTVPYFEESYTSNSYRQWPPSPVKAEPQEQVLSPDITMLQRIVELPVTPAVIDHVVTRVAKAVEVGLGRPLSSSSSSSSSSTSSSPSSEHSSSSSSSSKPTPNPIPTLAEFTVFTSAVFRRAEVKMPVVLGTLVYIERAMPYLRISIEEYALHRVLLGALILASKYLNDSSLKNTHWALCTQLFGKRDVGRIEREFLVVLDWELGVKEKEVCAAARDVWAVVGQDIEAKVTVEKDIVMEVEQKASSRHLAPIDTSSATLASSKPRYKTHHRGGPRAQRGRDDISPAFSSTSSCESMSPPPRTPGDGIPLSSSSTSSSATAVGSATTTTKQPTSRLTMSLPPIKTLAAGLPIPPPQSLPIAYRPLSASAIAMDVDYEDSRSHHHHHQQYSATYSHKHQRSDSVKKLLDSFPLPTLPHPIPKHEFEEDRYMSIQQQEQTFKQPQSTQIPYLPAYQFPEVPISV